MLHAASASNFVMPLVLSPTKTLYQTLCYPAPPRGGGGATRDRTADLLNANQALSHLSYSPIMNVGLVGLGRFELPTSPLSGVRSNQLSYRPMRLHPTVLRGINQQMKTKVWTLETVPFV